MKTFSRYKILLKFASFINALFFQTQIPSNPSHPLILSRRSLRSMTGQPLSDDQLIVLFEASHFSPSHFGQTWRFIYAKRETEYWDAFFEALTEENQRWARDASVLVVVISKSTMLNSNSNGEESAKSHHFEAGTAWMAMVLEGSSRSLVLHAINGFDVEKAKNAIGLTDETGLYTVEVMIAIGVPDLYNAEYEEITLRQEIDHFISEGTFVEKDQTEKTTDSNMVTEKETQGEEKAKVEEQQNDVPNTDEESGNKVKEGTAEETNQNAPIVDENSIELAIEGADEKESAPSDAVEEEGKKELADTDEPANEPEKDEKDSF